MPNRRRKSENNKTKRLSAQAVEVNIVNSKNRHKQKSNPQSFSERLIQPTLNSKEIKQKKTIMWIGVSVSMVAFFLLWFFSLSGQFKNNDKNNSELQWNQARAELDQALTQVKNGIEEIKRAQTNTPEKISEEIEPTAEQLELLKDKLLDEVEIGTATSTGR